MTGRMTDGVILETRVDGEQWEAQQRRAQTKIDQNGLASRMPLIALSFSYNHLHLRLLCAMSEQQKTAFENFCDNVGFFNRLSRIENLRLGVDGATSDDETNEDVDMDDHTQISSTDSHTARLKLAPVANAGTDIFVRTSQYVPRCSYCFDTGSLLKCSGENCDIRLCFRTTGNRKPCIAPFDSNIELHSASVFFCLECQKKAQVS